MRSIYVVINKNTEISLNWNSEVKFILTGYRNVGSIIQFQLLIMHLKELNCRFIPCPMKVPNTIYVTFFFFFLITIESVEMLRLSCEQFKTNVHSARIY